MTLTKTQLECIAGFCIGLAVVLLLVRLVDVKIVVMVAESPLPKQGASVIDADMVLAT
jgi:hypothetical protein